MGLRRKLFRIATTVVVLLIFAVALWTLYLELGRYPTEQLLAAATAVAPRQLLFALLLLAASYALTSVSEYLAALYGGLRLSPGRAAAAAFIAVGVGNSVSFGLLTSGALRNRLYAGWGLSGLETTKVHTFSTASYWLGYSLLAGTSLLILPPGALPVTKVAGVALPLLGILLLLLGPLYLLLAGLFRRGVRLRNLRFRPPDPKLAAARLISAGMNWFVAATMLFLLLPPSPGTSYVLYLAAFALAMLAGAISQLPGGIGVFDSALLFLLSPLYSVPLVTGALILYRLIYFVLPLLIGLGTLLSRERFYERGRLQAAAKRFGCRVASLLPSAMTLALFLSGVLLLFSGATPAASGRMGMLQTVLPLPVVEVSHLLASVLGLFLLFLARGLQRRLVVAYAASVVLIVSAILVSLAKGGAYEEAVILAGVLGALISVRGSFYRQSRLFGAPFSARWNAAILLVLMATAWLTVFANRPVSLNRYLFLQVTPEGDAARSLRALAGVTGVAVVLFLLRALFSWLETPPGRPDARSPIIRRIVADTSAAYAYLPFMNDKHFFLNEEQDAFIMFDRSGKSWIAMGDPVGPQERWPELVWRFKEECDRQGYRPLFYEVSKESLPLYDELGLASLALGQEARVWLPEFSLRGRENHDLRNAANRITREGWECAVLSAKESEKLYRYGDHFYAFSGLRSYKEKFSPAWETKYVAAPPGLALPGALLDLSRRASGVRSGRKRIIVDRSETAP
jgi:phosphatidylglycerol lysyltransferase